jgi:hypothetical protein
MACPKEHLMRSDCSSLDPAHSGHTLAPLLASVATSALLISGLRRRSQQARLDRTLQSAHHLRSRGRRGCSYDFRRLGAAGSLHVPRSFREPTSSALLPWHCPRAVGVGTTWSRWYSRPGAPGGDPPGMVVCPLPTAPVLPGTGGRRRASLEDGHIVNMATTTREQRRIAFRNGMVVSNEPDGRRRDEQDGRDPRNGWSIGRNKERRNIVNRNTISATKGWAP